MFAVVVTFQIKAGHMAAFLPHMVANAAASLKHEPECHRFDVWTDSARPDEVFLYEVYTDQAAFDAHLASAHFQAFDQTVGAMIASKHVQTYQRVHA